MVREQTEVSMVLVLESEVKTMTRGIPYKFAIQKSPKINTLWEPFRHFILAFQNFMKPIVFERGDPRL